MNIDQRIMIIDDGGMLRYEFSLKQDPLYLSKISNSLFSGMITAISTISNELGGSIQILVIGTEKLASRFINIFGLRFILIVADIYNCRDDLLLLKTEIVCRQITQMIESDTLPKNNSEKFKLTQLEKYFKETLDADLLKTTLITNSTKLLIKQSKMIPTDHSNLENMINALVKEIPSLELISDPGLILVDNLIIVPFNLQEITRRRLYDQIKNTIEPIVGSRFLDLLLEKFSISIE